MRRNYLYCLIITGILWSLAPPSYSQDKPAEQTKLMAEIPPTAPTSGFRAEFLEELTYYEQRYMRLAEAMPAEKYAWRPAEGVRSVGEVFAHIAAVNVLVGRTLSGPLKLGVTYGVDNQTVIKNTMALSGDKEKLLHYLKDSFTSLRNTVLHLGDADADKPPAIFNRHTTLRGSFIAITGHLGEHLGQASAYARMNGVVPPWTEGFQQQPKPADKPKQ